MFFSASCGSCRYCLSNCLRRLQPVLLAGLYCIAQRLVIAGFPPYPIALNQRRKKASAQALELGEVEVQ